MIMTVMQGAANARAVDGFFCFFNVPQTGK